MLKHKEEIGDILTEIDFQQLKIENAERIEQLENRNMEFFRLKTDGIATTHSLNIYKVNSFSFYKIEIKYLASVYLVIKRNILNELPLLLFIIITATFMIIIIIRRCLLMYNNTI